MASRSSHPLLLAVVLLSILAAAAGDDTDWCEPGLVIPLNPLRACRSYLVRRTCGAGAYPALPVMKARCCRELEGIVAYCRCRALGKLIDNVPSPGVGEATPCSWWEGQVELPRTLVTEAECNLPTIHGAPYCLALGAEE